MATTTTTWQSSDRPHDGKTNNNITPKSKRQHQTSPSCSDPSIPRISLTNTKNWLQIAPPFLPHIAPRSCPIHPSTPERTNPIHSPTRLPSHIPFPLPDGASHAGLPLPALTYIHIHTYTHSLTTSTLIPLFLCAKTTKNSLPLPHVNIDRSAQTLVVVCTSHFSPNKPPPHSLSISSVRTIALASFLILRNYLLLGISPSPHHEGKKSRSLASSASPLSRARFAPPAAAATSVSSDRVRTPTPVSIVSICI